MVALQELAQNICMHAANCTVCTDARSYIYSHARVHAIMITCSVDIHLATLKDVSDNAVLLHQRETQLAQRRERYQWQKFPDWGMPSGIDSNVKNLPPDEKFERVRLLNFGTSAYTAYAVLGKTGENVDVDSLDGYEKFASALGTPEVNVYVTHRWVTDVEFGRQILNGVNPVVIRKCTTLPSNFPVTNDMVKGLLNRGLTLQQEIKVCITINLY